MLQNADILDNWASAYVAYAKRMVQAWMLDRDRKGVLCLCYNGEGHLVGMVWFRVQLGWHFSVFRSERVVTKPDLSLTGVLFLTSKCKSESHMKVCRLESDTLLCCFRLFLGKLQKGTCVVLSYCISYSFLHHETFLSWCESRDKNPLEHFGQKCRTALQTREYPSEECGSNAPVKT